MKNEEQDQNNIKFRYMVATVWNAKPKEVRTQFVGINYEILIKDSFPGD